MGPTWRDTADSVEIVRSHTTCRDVSAITGPGWQPPQWPETFVRARAQMTARSAGPRGYDLSSLRVVGATGELWDQQSWQWCFETICGGARAAAQLLRRN